MDFEIRRIVEHDIDMIILRSFRDGSRVEKLFLDKCGITSATLTKIGNSAYQNDGREEDVEIELSDGDNTINILVEDKVDAPFQDNQLEDYLKHASEFDNCKVVLLAPEKYYLNVNEGLKDRIEFISYEDLEKALREDGDVFSADVVKKALEEKPNHRGPKNLCDEVTDFYKEYKGYVNSKGLDITYNGNDKRGTKSNWVYYVTNDPKLRIIHKGQLGKVDVICCEDTESYKVPEMSFTDKLRNQEEVLDKVIDIVKGIVNGNRGLYLRVKYVLKQYKPGDILFAGIPIVKPENSFFHPELLELFASVSAPDDYATIKEKLFVDVPNQPSLQGMSIREYMEAGSRARKYIKEHQKDVCGLNVKIEEMTLAEVDSFLYWVMNHERVCEGFIQNLCEEGTLLRVIERRLELTKPA